MGARTAILLALLAALVCACHTRPPRVDCEEHLSPINAPAPLAPSGERHP